MICKTLVNFNLSQSADKIIKTAPENSGAYYMYHCVKPSFFAISAVLSSSSLETPSSCIVTP